MSQTQSPASEPVKKTGILSRVQAASDMTVIPKFLISGAHGAGKTRCMATADNLIAVLFEGNQSKSTIRSTNRTAEVLEVRSGPDGIKDWREIYKVIINGELDGYGMLGIDSLNELQNRYDADIEEMAKITAKAAQTGGSQRKGSDKGGWAVRREKLSKMTNIFVFLRDISLPVAATVRTKSYTEKDTEITRTNFSLEDQVRDNVGSYFTASAYIYKMETAVVGESRRAAMFSGPDNYPCREMEALRGICEPSIPRWMEALSIGSAPEGLYIQDARLPGERYNRKASLDTSDI